MSIPSIPPTTPAFTENSSLELKPRNQRITEEGLEHLRELTKLFHLKLEDPTAQTQPAQTQLTDADKRAILKAFLGKISTKPLELPTSSLKPDEKQ